MVIEPDGEVDTKAYPLRMILGNSIPGLLPCRLQKADGKVLFYYDVTARQQIGNTYQKLGYEELRILYQGLLKIFEQMDKYLLDTSQLLLAAEYIYLDKKAGNLYLCYLPGYDKPVREQLRGFAEYLLSFVDHQDSRGVKLSYGIYRLLAEEGFQTEAVEEIIRTAQEQEGYKAEIPEHPQKKSEPLPNIVKQKNSKAAVFLFAVGLCLLAGFLILRRMGYLSGITLPILLAMLFGGILAASWVARKKKRMPSNEAPCQPLEPHGPALVCEETKEILPILLDRDTDGQIPARIQKKEDGYWIARLPSGKEIFLNGKKLECEEEYRMQPEDRVAFAGRCYRFTQE